MREVSVEIAVSCNSRCTVLVSMDECVFGFPGDAKVLTLR